MKVAFFLIVCFYSVHYSCSTSPYLPCSSDVIHSCTSNEIEIDNNNPFKKDYEVLGLLKIALRSESDQNEANAKFKEKFGHKQVKITNIPKENNYFLSHGNCLCIDHELAEDFLKAFGKSIKNLAIAYRFIPSFKQANIGEFVNIYCHETLEEFHAQYCKEWVKGVLNGMRKPFINVERVNFDGEWMELTEKSLGFNELFPKMRVLNLSYENGYIFDHNYPHLVELNAAKSTSPNFTKLIENNPQIKKLTVQDTSVEFLKVLNKKLPELEVLAFNVPTELNQYNGSQIYFEHVTDVSITDRLKIFNADKIRFKQLNQFTLAAYEHIDDEWIEFIGDNKDLRKLVISEGYLNSTALLKLSKEINSLIEARIRCDFYTDIKAIVEFIESNKHMETVTVIIRRNSVAEKLSKLLTDEWKVVPVNGDHLPMNGGYFMFNLMKSTSTPNPVQIITDVLNSTETDDQNSTQSTTGKPGGGASSMYKGLTLTFVLFISSIFVSLI